VDQLPRGRAVRATVAHSTTGIVQVAAPCTSCSASELLLACQQRAHGRVPRRRASETHKSTRYHECSAERAMESFSPPLVCCAWLQRRAGRDGEVRATLRRLFRVASDRVWPGAAQPAVRARRTSSASRPCVSCERGSTRTMRRFVTTRSVVISVCELG